MFRILLLAKICRQYAGMSESDKPLAFISMRELITFYLFFPSGSHMKDRVVPGRNHCLEPPRQKPESCSHFDPCRMPQG